MRATDKTDALLGSVFICSFYPFDPWLISLTYQCALDGKLAGDFT